MNCGTIWGTTAYRTTCSGLAPVAVIASIGPRSMLSIASEYSLPSAAMLCTPRAQEREGDREEHTHRRAHQREEDRLDHAVDHDDEGRAGPERSGARGDLRDDEVPGPLRRRGGEADGEAALAVGHERGDLLALADLVLPPEHTRAPRREPPALRPDPGPDRPGTGGEDEAGTRRGRRRGWRLPSIVERRGRSLRPGLPREDVRGRKRDDERLDQPRAPPQLREMDLRDPPPVAVDQEHHGAAGVESPRPVPDRGTGAGRRPEVGLLEGHQPISTATASSP